MATYSKTGSINSSFKLELTVTESDVSTANNTSKVNWTVKLKSTGAYSFELIGSTVTVSIAGEEVFNKYSQKTIAAGGTLTIGSGSKVITHNDDGSKSVKCTAKWDQSSTSSYTPGDMTASGTLPLTTIARASSVACSSPYIGDVATITIDKKATAFTSTVTYNISGITGTVATKTSATTLSLNTAGIADQIYEKIPRATQIAGTIFCTTYSGSEQVGDTKSTTFNLYAKESVCKPNVSLAVVDTNSTAINLTGDNSKIIKYISKPKVTLTATPNKSSTIQSWTISVNDGQSKSTKEGIFSSVTGNVFTGTAKDSRGYSNSVSKTVTMIDYVPLTITSLTVHRPEELSDELILDAKGAWFNGRFSDTTVNSINAKIEYKLSSDTEYTYLADLKPVLNGNTWSLVSCSLGTGYSSDNEYQVRVTVTDLLQTQSRVVTAPKGQEVVTIGEDAVWIMGEKAMTNKVIAKKLGNRAWFRVIQLTKGKQGVVTTGSFLVDINTNYNYDNNMSAMLLVNIAYRTARIKLLGAMNNSNVISAARVTQDGDYYYLEIYYDSTNENSVYVSVLNQTLSEFNTVKMLDFEAPTDTATILASTQLQYGLSPAANGWDANGMKKTGIYYGNDLVNTPSKWGYMFVISHNSSFNYTLQYFVSQGSYGSLTYVREQNNGTWSSWRQSDVVRLAGTLPSGTNLNDLYSQTGIKTYIVDAYANSYTNFPSTAYQYGQLIVITQGTGAQWYNSQIYIPHQSKYEVYFRVSTDTWRKMPTNLTFQAGYVTMTPTANSPTWVNVSFPSAFRAAPKVIVMPTTSVPGNIVLGASATSVDQNGFTLYVTRTNSTSTGITWYAYLP